MDVVMKRCISDVRAKKERPIPVKITRSVGLQVHMGPPVSSDYFTVLQAKSPILTV